METLIFIGVLVLIVISIIAAGVKVVPQSETRVIERLGKYHSTLPAGLNLIIPFIDRPRQYTHARWSVCPTDDISRGCSLPR